MQLSDVPVASVIIPTYQRPSFLAKALRSIRTVDFDGKDYEVLVIDNGPNAEAKPVVDAATRNGMRVAYFHEPRLGLHNGRHRGAREARGEILVYVDDDVSVSAGWLRAIIDPFIDPLVASVGGKIVPLWEDCQPPDWWPDISEHFLSLLDLGDTRLELSWPQCLNGCNLAVRSSILFEVGGFNPDAIGDPRFIWLRGDGETGLLKKIYRGGYKVIYEPTAWLYHCIPASRLEPDYFFWRAFIEGISDSYSCIRQSPSRRRMFFQASRSFFQAACKKYDATKNPPNKISTLCAAWYWYGKGQHQLRATLSQKLYHHIVKETYF